MSGAARRLQRRGHPVAGERLEGVEAHYRNKGDAFTVRVDSRSTDMAQLYAALTEYVALPLDVADAFAAIDAVAAQPYLRKQRLPWEQVLLALMNVHWLEHHAHLATDKDNGMRFVYSRPDPRSPGKRVGFIRETLDPTPGQETAFARAMDEASDGQILKVPEDPVE